MRIIAGELRGRRLKAPRGTETRPTSDRVREAVFDILQARVEGAAVLDLFAGSGAMGIEALSRGAIHATFVESRRDACACIAGNLSSLGLTDRADMVCAPVEGTLAHEPSTGPFDLIFLDPPYRIGPASSGELMAELLQRRWAAASALLVVEHAAGSPPETGPLLRRETLRKYGDTGISIYSV